MGSQLEPRASGRILFVDAFDSFTNNVIGLLEEALDVDVTLVRIDDDKFARNLKFSLSAFDAVVVGPGPGNPANPKDVGLINLLWSLPDEHMLPVLGICLGHQSLCLAFGASVIRLGTPRHGIVSTIHHRGEDIFEGVSAMHATQYHSLHVDLGYPNTSPSTPLPLDSDESRWTPNMKSSCHALCPLAWGPEDEGKPVLMGVRHTSKPFWGLQFHPESICTSPDAKTILSNWWSRSQEWSLRFRSKKSVQNGEEYLAGSSLVEDILSMTRRSSYGPDPKLIWETRPAQNVSADALCEALRLDQAEVILLDSQGHVGDRGRFSILGLVDAETTLKFTYSVHDKMVRYGNGPAIKAQRLRSIDQVWPVLQAVTDAHNPKTGAGDTGSLPEESPFWGGFAGYITYEAGLETIKVEAPRPNNIPDVNFAFIQRSIVVDHVQGQAYIQSILPEDAEWISHTANIVDQLQAENHSKLSWDGPRDVHMATSVQQAHINRPNELDYRRKVLECQDFLRSGDSYELCLTGQTEIRLPAVDGQEPGAWSLYKRLRHRNPAPFGAFITLSGANVVGSSPERFLSWTRSGHCQFRPIKGTVKKSPHMTRDMAHEILNSSKERAENLMIVDLIRHDLGGVVGAANVWVSQLMVVEEYATVYQLVSVIEGQCQGQRGLVSDGLGGPSPSESSIHLPTPSSSSGSGAVSSVFEPSGSLTRSASSCSSAAADTKPPARGLDVLAASLPPGSMTGAPKKRSCEILCELEPANRGVYSGVLGYLDVGGGGDFSVVIRTAVRSTTGAITSKGLVNGHVHDNVDGNGTTHERDSTYHVGAGGAVTIQSTDEGEFVEMDTKLSSVLGAFLPFKQD